MVIELSETTQRRASLRSPTSHSLLEKVSLDLIWSYLRRKDWRALEKVWKGWSATRKQQFSRKFGHIGSRLKVPIDDQRINSSWRKASLPMLYFRLHWSYSNLKNTLSCSMCKGSFYKLGLGKPIKSSSASGIYEGRIPLCFLRGIADLLSEARLPVCLLNKESRNRRRIHWHS